MASLTDWRTVAAVAGFVATRVLNVWLAHSPTNLGAGFGDLEKFESWSSGIVHGNLGAYSDVPIEYPPGILPFITAARLVPLGQLDYAHRFIWIMLLLDVAGFAGLVLLARRGGSSLGPWTWIAGGVLLGPIIYLRLDLIPAVATVWAIERASVGNWTGVGAWLGLGAVAKIYPVFLLAPAIAIVPRAAVRRLVMSAALVAAALIVPFVLMGSGPELLDNVVGYHSRRGVHVESTWGFLLLAASKSGYGMYPNFQFGANEAVSGLSPLFKSLGVTLSFIAAGVAWSVTKRSVRTGDARGLAASMYGLLALVMFFGTVFSPQYAVWLVALAASALCWPTTHRQRASLLAVLAIAALTQIVFPYTIDDVLAPFYSGGSEAGSPVGLAVLGLRNLVVLAAGAAMLWTLDADAHNRAASP